MKRCSLIIIVMFSFMLNAFAADTNWAESKFQAVRKMIDAKNYEAAELLLKAVIEQDAENAEAYYYTGLCQEKQKKIPKALESYEKSRRLFLSREMNLQERQVYEKATAALKKLDKAMPIALKAADSIESKAKRYRTKDPFAYKRLMELAAGLRAPWTDAPVKMIKKTGDAKKEVTECAEEFLDYLIKGNLNQAKTYFDPEFRKKKGSMAVINILNVWSGSIKTKWKHTVRVKIGKVTIAEDKDHAEVIPVTNEGKNGQPLKWIRRESRWYISGE